MKSQSELEIQIVVMQDSIEYHKRMIGLESARIAELRGELQRRDFEAQIEQLETDT